MITIIDYGMGNPESIRNMIKKAGGRAIISHDEKAISEATSLILPGVGHFGTAMIEISKKLRDIIDKKVKVDKTPLLGICLGMQLLFDHSEEGNSPGLGYISGEVLKFQFTNPEFKIPHMGWNEIRIAKENSLFERGEELPRFYFVHSYFARCADQGDVLATCDYNGVFHCAVQKDHVTGVQFHPEKSHKFGLQFFKNYLKQHAGKV